MKTDKIISTVLRLIKKNGQQVTLTRMQDGVYDPQSGTVSRTGTTYTGFGVPMPYRYRDVDGTRILQSDVQVYVAPQIGSTPRPSDTLTVGGQVFQVIASNPLAPAGPIVLHDVQCRKA